MLIDLVDYGRPDSAGKRYLLTCRDSYWISRRWTSFQQNTQLGFKSSIETNIEALNFPKIVWMYVCSLLNVPAENGVTDLLSFPQRGNNCMSSENNLFSELSEKSRRAQTPRIPEAELLKHRKIHWTAAARPIIIINSLQFERVHTMNQGCKITPPKVHPPRGWGEKIGLHSNLGIFFLI